MTGNISIVDGVPPAETFSLWREDQGWGTLSVVDAARCLAASTACVVALDGDDLIGFGRVVGDGTLYFYIQDLIVRSDRRGEGIGDAIMTGLLGRIYEIAARPATICLMSAKGYERFYERHGFLSRPNADFGAGMMRLLA